VFDAGSVNKRLCGQWDGNVGRSRDRSPGDELRDYYARSRQIGLETGWQDARLSAVPDPLWWQGWQVSMHG